MDTFPKFEVCEQQFTFKGPTPFLLPCLHAVCETCLTSASGGVISCSTCQKEVNLSETHLQEDVVRQREIFHLTVQHRPSGILCTHEDDGNQAVCWCRECREFLCEYCHNLHNGFAATRRHAVQEIGDSQPCSIDSEEYCNTHEKYILEFWDKHCNILICSKCRRGDHSKHDVEETDQAAQTARAEVEEQKKAMEYVERQNVKSLDRIQRQLICTDENYSTLTEKASHVFSSLKVEIDQKDKETAIELKEQTDEIKSSLNTKSKSVQRSQTACASTMEYINKALLYSSRRDLLNLKKMITDTAQICLSSAPSEIQGDTGLPVFNSEKFERLKSRILSKSDLALEEPNSLSGRKTWQDESSQTDDGYVIQPAEIDQRKEVCTRHIFWFAAVVAIVAVVAVMTVQRINPPQGFRNDYTSYLLKPETASASIFLHCIHLEYDLGMVNLDVVSIDNDGDLVTIPNPTTHGNSKMRLRTYHGTSSTHPLPMVGNPVYWEVEAMVFLNEPLSVNSLVLEIGFSVASEMDRNICLCNSSHPMTYSMTVNYCTDYNSICSLIWRSKLINSFPDTMYDYLYDWVQLRYGVVYDDVRRKIVFIDVKKKMVLSVLGNVDTSQPMWPMFGVYGEDGHIVYMKLVVGSNIDMTEDKKTLILNALM